MLRQVSKKPVENGAQCSVGQRIHHARCSRPSPTSEATTCSAERSAKTTTTTKAAQTRPAKPRPHVQARTGPPLRVGVPVSEDTPATGTEGRVRSARSIEAAAYSHNVGIRCYVTAAAQRELAAMVPLATTDPLVPCSLC
jgi:hypothetical protein